MAIVCLLVFTLLLGMFEFGLLFRDHLTATDAVSDATRIGAIVGPDVANDGSNADFAIVNALRQGLSGMNDSAVKYIVVFRGSGTDDAPEDQVPERCKRGTSIRNICNAYPARDAFAAVDGGDTTYFVCPDPATSKVACNWDPAKRKDGPTSSDVESIGVFVAIARDGYTGMFADTWSINRAATSRLEPGVIEP